MGHRALVCAALAQGSSQVEGVSVSRDILATCDCLRQLGAVITSREETGGRTAFTVEGTRPHQVGTEMDCGESGSTLRFLIPLAALTGDAFTFQGSGKLGSRPLEPMKPFSASKAWCSEKGAPGTIFP